MKKTQNPYEPDGPLEVIIGTSAQVDAFIAKQKDDRLSLVGMCASCGFPEQFVPGSNGCVSCPAAA